MTSVELQARKATALKIKRQAINLFCLLVIYYKNKKATTSEKDAIKMLIELII
jgi:hypothetical protein